MTYKLQSIMALAMTSLMALPAFSPAQEDTPLDTLKKANAAIQRFTLDNGMTCLVKEDHSAPVVAVQIWVGAGSIHEEKYLGSGLSHAVEHMIFKGTPTRPIGAITKEINEAGGTINAHTSFERTVFHTVMPRAQWQVGLDVLADAVMHPSFPEEEWTKEREVIIREMAMGRDDPHRVLSKLLWRTAYDVHPYKHPIIGYEDVFKERTRDDLADMYANNYTPDNMVAVIVGDVNPDEVKEEMAEAFSSFKRRARAPIVLPSEPEQISPRFAKETGAYNVSRLHWAYPSVALQHEDAPSLDVLSSIVGQGNSSRLVQQLRDRQKLVHEISAWSWTPKEAGLFTISATYDPDKEDQLLKAIKEEVDRWTSSPFPQEEVEKAKRMILVNELSQLQTMEGQANSIGSGEFYAGDPRFSERYLELIDAVTPESLMEVARRYLVPHKRTVVILGPESEKKESIQQAARTEASMGAEKRVLKNGIPVIVQQDDRLPFVYVCIALRGGLLSENEENNGITRLMAELLTRGTKNRTAAEIATAVESLGAHLSPFSGDNSFGIQARCLSQDVDTLFALLSECLLEPSFPQEELEQKRAEQIAAIRQQHEKPFFIARQALTQALFPGHPYAGNALGTVESVESIDREDIVRHFTQHLTTGNAVLSVLGNISGDDAVRLAEQYVGNIPRGGIQDPQLPEPEPDLPIRVEQREPKEQAILLVGFPGVAVTDPRADALSFLQTAFSGLSSELGTEVREKRGLVYYVGAIQKPGVEPGYFTFYAGTREDAVPELEQLIQDEMERVGESGLDEDEFARVREQMIGRHQMQMQDMAYVAQICALNELYGLGFNHIFSYEKRIADLTQDMIRKTARSVLTPEKQVTSVVLPEPTENETKENIHGNYEQQ